MTEYFFNFHGELAKNEWKIYNNNTHQFIEMYGVPILYLPRVAVSQDDLFGEDSLSSYVETKELKVYLENNENFNGDGDFWGKFGFQKDDTMRFRIQQDYLDETLEGPPEEGDIIQFGFNNNLYEIYFIEVDSEVFFLNGYQTTYGISVRLMQYSGETMNTEVDNIDKVNDENTSDMDDSIQEFENILDFAETSPFGEEF